MGEENKITPSPGGGRGAGSGRGSGGAEDGLRRLVSLLAAAGLITVLLLLLIQRFGPSPQLALRDSVPLQVYVGAVMALSGAALTWQIVRAYRQITTIRTRLVIVSAATVLLTTLAISAGSILIGYRNGQREAVDRLELVATLREVEIDGWVQHIQDTLAGSLQQAPEHRFVEPEMASVVATLVDAPAESEEHRRAYEFLAYNFEQWLKQAQQFDVIFFMDRHGTVLVATDPALEGEVYADETYFNRGTVGSYMEPLSYSPSLGRATLFASRPILGEYGRLLGVLAGRVDGSSLTRALRSRQQASLGQTGETYLVDADATMVTDSRFAEAGASVRTPGAVAAIQRHENGSGTYANYEGTRVMGVYRWLPDLQVALMAEQGRAEVLSAVNRTAALNGAISLVALVFAGVGAVTTAWRIGDPLSDLAETASEIAAGDLERTAEVDRRDEIGTLADAFNRMTARLRGLIGQLESRVEERTRDLELRSAYLEASAEVGRAASEMLDVDRLVEEVVGLIRDRFGLYYVGLFLVDEMGEWAELRAGTGDAGREMLAQKHRLRVGGQSMIGQCVARSEARITLDVGEEPVRFDNPLLPETRSEGALPLASRGRVLGAITVQSAQPAAFDEDTLTVLQTMADQVAVALDNAYLFREAEDALEAARRAQAEATREAWTEMLRFRPTVGFHSDDRGVRDAGDIWRPEMEEALRTGQTVTGETPEASEGYEGRVVLAVPVRVAGQVIGVVDTYKPASAGAWTPAEVETLESLADQLGASLESARLHQETQRRAARDRLVSEISARLRASMNPDTVLKTTVRGLGQALDAELASVELTGPVTGDGGSAAGGGVEEEE
ncbi:MAG: GAF domain-containing protein [Chloroflexota bacterium]|nr:GAF domain-containing protein [Chloroflexota bacterium]